MAPEQLEAVVAERMAYFNRDRRPSTIGYRALRAISRLGSHGRSVTIPKVKNCPSSVVHRYVNNKTIMLLARNKNGSLEFAPPRTVTA